MTIENEIGILSTKIGHIDEAVSGMNKNVNIILEKLDQQNGDLIRAKKDIEFIKKETEDNKTEHKEDISILWKELRRRDKKIMWLTGTGISVAVLIMAAFNYFG